MVTALNPRARIVEAVRGAVPLGEVLDTGLFDLAAAEENPGWLAEPRGSHMPETEEYGITSFVYRARRPFHPARFNELIAEEWPGVIRSKGYFWLATRMEFAGGWSQAGGICGSHAAGLWWAAADRALWPEDEAAREPIWKNWREPFGDRRQELVLIGIDMDRDAITARFDECLLTDEEMELGPLGWSTFADPFPRWAVTEEMAEEG
jgi:G3E family GTPase